MTPYSPLTRREKIRTIIEAIREIRTIAKGNGNGELLHELKKEWIQLGHEIIDLTMKQSISGVNNSARIYAMEQKQATVFRLFEEMVVNFPFSLIRNILYTRELCTYDLIIRTLYAHIDIDKGQSRTKALAAYKESIASNLFIFGYSKVQCELIAKHISEMIFGDTKGVNFPRKHEIYKSKFILDYIVSFTS